MIAIIQGENLLDAAAAGSEVTVILDQTPFYGESGGQLGDTGVLESNGCTVQITDTKRNNEFVLHSGKVVKGKLEKNSTVHAKVDTQRRNAIRRNHTATHILHYALCRVIGQHAEQAGSLVANDRMRFDFQHFSGLTREELTQIEDIVNEKILENAPLSVKEMTIQEAKKPAQRHCLVKNMGNG